MKTIKFLALMLFSISAFATDISLSWEAPTKDVNGGKLTQIDGFNLYYSVNNGTQNVFELGNISSHTLNDVQTGGYVFQISTVANGLESELSAPVFVTISESRPVKIKLVVEVD